tara:strand:- start:13550 stop:13774 length:225 start_codon:yes stop_codon:yes gene_type:complete
MVSKKDLKEYGFEIVEYYFEMIIDSIVNGQRTQAREQINDLSKEQKKDFLWWLDHYENRSKQATEARQFTIEAL